MLSAAGAGGGGSGGRGKSGGKPFKFKKKKKKDGADDGDKSDKESNQVDIHHQDGKDRRESYGKDEMDRKSDKQDHQHNTLYQTISER